jgi:hypothetical protein
VDSTVAPEQDVSRFVSISRGRVRRLPDGRRRQALTLRYTGPITLNGPFRLVVENLRPGVRLVRPAGTTLIHPLLPESVSPYVFVDVGSDNQLSPGDTATVRLTFTRRPRIYNTQVIAGGLRP